MRRAMPIVALSVVLSSTESWVAAQTTVSPGIGVGASMHTERVPARVDEVSIGRRNIARNWVAKFLCGEIPPSGSLEQGTPLAPGSYRTTINVFNAQLSHPVNLFPQVFVARAPGEPYTRALIREPVVIDEWQAATFDCDYIRGVLGAPTGFIEGFLRLRAFTDDRGDPSNNEVIAVYTLKNVEAHASVPPNPQPNE